MKKIAIGTLLVFTSVFSVMAQNLMQTLVVVKHTDSEAITVKELKDMVDFQEKQAGRKITPKEREQVLNQIVEQKLVMQAAKKAGITVSAQQIDQKFLEDTAARLGLQRILSEKELDDACRQSNKLPFAQYFKEQNGISVNDYKDKVIKPPVIAELYIRTLYADKFNKIVVSGKDIDQFYELNKYKYFNKAESLRMFRVVVPREKNPGAKAKIDKLLADYKSGKTTIEKLLIDGTEPNAEKNGFVSGYTPILKTAEYAAMVGLTEDRMMALFEEKLNTPSDVVEQEQFYEFYVITEKEPAKLLTLTDVYVNTERGPVRVAQAIEQRIMMERAKIIFDDGLKEIVAKLNTPEFVQKKKTDEELIKVLSW